MATPEEVLKRFFGYDTFRRSQREAIGSLLAGRDVMCVMPTGAGKSICYQIPAMMLPGVAVVVSPLISLMKDQVDALRQSGVPADAINSGMEWDEVRPVFRRAREYAIKLLYIAPERLDSDGFREFLSDVDISIVVVDEAHCVSHWGHDFRPSYLGIAPAVASLPRRPHVAAFTATATPDVRDDIMTQLALVEPDVYVTGFDRENLFFQVERPADKVAFVLSYVKKFPDLPGIVYCATRKNVERVCAELQDAGIAAVRYHAGLDDAERRANQEAFIYDRASVMVATTAFGMGIDKSNVRYVIHYNMPTSIDAYYQEAGRAGRDGAPADCIMLYSPHDISTARYLISNSDDRAARDAAEKKLASMIDYAKTEGCLRRAILNYFGETDAPERCGNCGSCSSVLDRHDVTVAAQKVISCVYRAAERTGGHKFDADVIASVLRGESCDEVEAHELDKTSTWGIMCDCARDEILRTADFLTAEGLLRRTSAGLEFTDRTKRFLKSSTRLIMRSYGRGAQGGEGSNTEFFETLRRLRRDIAAREGVPPYVIFTDKTLMAICARMPETEDEMLAVPGVGSVKLSRYGREFITAVRVHKYARTDVAR